MRKIFFLLALVTIIPVLAQDVMNPVADPDAVVVSGKMRFTVLTSKMIRIEYSPTSQFEDRATFAVVNRRLPVPSFTQREEGGYLYITTEDCELRYKVGTTPNPASKTPNYLQITFNMNGIQSVWYPGKDDSMNLLGTNRTLDTAWGDNARNKLEKGLISRAGWSIIDESPATTRGDGSTTLPMVLNEDGYQWWEKALNQKNYDWYFLGYGHDYKQCILDFTKIGGRVPLPPKYIFGYWYSRYWAYSQTDFQNIITDVEKNDIPMDVLILDMDWHRSGWTGWSWNTSKIPNPTGLLTYIHRHGLRTALNLHPSDGVSSSEDKYKNLRSAMGLPSTYTSTIPWTIQDYSFARPFFDQILRPLEKQGVDFWWIDWQQEKTAGEHAAAKGYELSDGCDKLSETFWCNHTFFEDMQKNRPELRPVIYHRWGGLGSHRYPICFSGDTWAAWSTLGYEIFFTSNASNVCYAYWGHDLGGHQGGNNDPELLLRWLQFGAYTPIFRTHATNDSKLERRIWKYSNFQQLREAVRERYRIFPYLYTAARETYDNGLGMNRPLYYDYPEDENAYAFEDEYMFGNDMLVAPIYTPSVNGYSSRKIWLPKGLWWDVTAGKLREGNSLLYSKFTLDEFPVFYKSGSIIPTYPVQRTTVTTPEQIYLTVTPGESGSGLLYEDDGANNDYLSGQSTTITFSQKRVGEHVLLTINGRQGSYTGMPETRTWTLRFPGVGQKPSEAITVNGVEVEESQISYDADKKVLEVSVPVTDLSKELLVKVALPKVETVGHAIEDEVSINEPETSPSGTKYYVKGSAVPGGIQELTRFPVPGSSSGYSYKFHGTLLPGKLYICTSTSASAPLLKPKQLNSNIVCDNVEYTRGTATDTINSAWIVTSRSDLYRFTVTPSTTTTGAVTGEIFTRWYEAWITGGCVADDQTPGAGNWQISAGKQMVQSWWDPNVFTWTGELKAYTTNDQPKRFKINGQYGWSPKVLHPFRQDESILTTSQLCYNGPNDDKWSIVNDGYYTIEVNVFLETIHGEYHGTEEPTGVDKAQAFGIGVKASGMQVSVTSERVVDLQLYTLEGSKVAEATGSLITIPVSQHGVYVLKATDGKEVVTRKVSL